MKRIYSRAEIEIEKSLTGAEKKNYDSTDSVTVLRSRSRYFLVGSGVKV